MILLVEDDPVLAELITEYLCAEGFELDYAQHGVQALNLIEANPYQLFIFDINLPRMDGMTLCQTVRKEGYLTPCLMLTARAALDDKIKGFESGADDYLTKPFALPELAARVTALTIRHQRVSEPIQSFGDLEINWFKKQLKLAETNIHLSAVEWALLKVFCERPHQPVSISELSAQLRPGETTSPDAIKMTIHRLRKKLNQPNNNVFIQANRGRGYVFFDE